MNWNYRVIEMKPDENGEKLFGLFEVSYDEAGDISCSCCEPEIVANSIEELRTTVKMMLDDIKHHQNGKYRILEEGKIEYASREWL